MNCARVLVRLVPPGPFGPLLFSKSFLWSLHCVPNGTFGPSFSSLGACRQQISEKPTSFFNDPYSTFECFGDQTAHLVKEGPNGSFEEHVRKGDELIRGRGDQTAHCAICFFMKMSEMSRLVPLPFPSLTEKCSMSRLAPF